VTLKVEDMACGHCASTITNAVEAASPVPGCKLTRAYHAINGTARVAADPAYRTVRVILG
jgi:copper chaperone CopZ